MSKKYVFFENVKKRKIHLRYPAPEILRDAQKYRLEIDIEKAVSTYIFGDGPKNTMTSIHGFLCIAAGVSINNDILCRDTFDIDILEPICEGAICWDPTAKIYGCTVTSISDNIGSIAIGLTCQSFIPCCQRNKCQTS